ncbi:hypothetical protein F2Q69_00017294 [Brassica cretica]|uniref:Uncharacterized protein n=1 Tax=Brassica cretica TaxID=69181 RepID=A0A8S9R5V8_BRACR|nr:hypothetical protein F2Q69_00017294 [Brassica cretica]
MASSRQCSHISLINLLSSWLLDPVNCGSLVDLLLSDCALICGCLGELVGSSSSRHSVPVFLHSVLGEGSSSITSLWAASGFVEDCTCGYGMIFKGGVLYPFFYTACALIESDDYKSETHRELATLEMT